MKKYYTQLSDYKHTPDNPTDEAGEMAEKNEILEFLDNKLVKRPASRRDFLKFCGFTFATAAVVSSCKNPVNKAIPYLIKPDDVTPGQGTYYASTFYDGRDYGSILVKVRDGRPIKIEGNDLSSISKGGTNARIQASLLSLYDKKGRYHGPLKGGNEATWKEADTEIGKMLREISASGGNTVLLTSSIISPATLQLIQSFTGRYSNLKHVVYDAISFSAMLEANKLSFGRQEIPSYHFNKAEVIVGFNADFLGTWLSPVEYTRQYSSTRVLNENRKSISRHIQVESGLSLTGSNADQRIVIKPSEEGKVLSSLYQILAKKAGMTVQSAGETRPEIVELAEELWAHRGESLVVSGTNDVSVQLIVNAINHVLDNVNRTLEFDHNFKCFQGIDKDMTDFVESLNNGKVAGVLFYNVNPVYDHPLGNKIAEGIKKARLSVSFASTLDETSAACQYVLPDHHYLESWNDAEPKNGSYSLTQPVIRPLFDTRSFQDTLLSWTGSSLDYHEYLKSHWQYNQFTRQTRMVSFTHFWDSSLQAGVFELETGVSGVSYAAEGLNNALEKAMKRAGDGTELYIYESIPMGNGKHANNPWLQELPDPIAKTTWDNFAAISPKFAKEKGILEEEIIRINDKIDLPVIVQPGMADNVIAVALGYGRTVSGKVGTGVGANVAPLAVVEDGHIMNYASGTQFKKTGALHVFAKSQIHESMEGRPIIRETKLEEWKKNPTAGNELHEEFEKHKVSLYPENPPLGNHWAMAIDLNKCTGCSACVIGCQAENNIPVIGKEEVRRKRLMHWIRIDRYYSDEITNPGVVFQPVMCQHCNNAPCENVCPVAATTHSHDGLNQMAYNRCIGTKYCINNCPYKVRRFNWYRYVDNEKFAFGTENETGKMVLNPDVTVRERGVVEKCSFCIQRIQENKVKAKSEERELRDGEVMPACGQACPSKAIVFGDLNDPNSEISKLYEDPRNYHILEELHTLPAVGYLTKVRNQK